MMNNKLFVRNHNLKQDMLENVLISRVEKTEYDEVRVEYLKCLDNERL